MESGGRSEKEATTAEINLWAIIKIKLGGCPLFLQFRQSRNVSALTK